MKLRVFGCLCFPLHRSYNTNKLEDRSTPCVFLGYSLTQSAYFCLQPSSRRIYTSRHVKFDETIYPFKSSIPQNPNNSETQKASQPPITKNPLRRPLIQQPPTQPGSTDINLQSTAPSPPESPDKEHDTSSSHETETSGNQSSTQSRTVTDLSSSPSNSIHTSRSPEKSPNRNSLKPTKH